MNAVVFLEHWAWVAIWIAWTYTLCASYADNMFNNLGLTVYKKEKDEEVVKVYSSSAELKESSSSASSKSKSSSTGVYPPASSESKKVK